MKTRSLSRRPLTQRPLSRTARLTSGTRIGVSLACLASAGSVGATVGVDTTALVEAVTVEAARAHQARFQEFADEGDGTREASSDGYLNSAIYISQLMIEAGYEVDLQVFPYVYFEDLSDPVFEQLAPVAISYPLDDPEGFTSATYSGQGDVTANVTAVDVILPAAADPNTSTSGCDADDFAGFPAGDIALVQRGACTFGQKVLNAQAAGAVGVIIFNEGQEGRTEAFGATLGEPGFTVPVVTASFAIGEVFAPGGAQARVSVDTLVENRISANVIAESRVGRSDRTLVVGAHLDSVDEGPGIQDNGSGSAGILEIALQLAALATADEMKVYNRLRFAWWGAEELGLLGSEYYVDNLTEEEIEEIALNLNFDMIGSPNYARFIYDGDGSVTDPAGPEGSAFIEWLFRDWFDQQGLASEPTAFSGRSDYGPFIAVGIPAGGLFTGAEGIKTEGQVALYGGTAGEAYDPCYHEACDTFDNISIEGFDQMLDAAANAVGVFAVNSLPAPPAAKLADGSTASFKRTAVETDFRGNRLER